MSVITFVQFVTNTQNCTIRLLFFKPSVYLRSLLRVTSCLSDQLHSFEKSVHSNSLLQRQSLQFMKFIVQFVQLPSGFVALYHDDYSFKERIAFWIYQRLPVPFLAFYSVTPIVLSNNYSILTLIKKTMISACSYCYLSSVLQEILSLKFSNLENFSYLPVTKELNSVSHCFSQDYILFSIKADT